MGTSKWPDKWAYCADLLQGHAWKWWLQHFKYQDINPLQSKRRRKERIVANCNNSLLEKKIFSEPFFWGWRHQILFRATVACIATANDWNKKEMPYALLTSYNQNKSQWKKIWCFHVKYKQYSFCVLLRLPNIPIILLKASTIMLHLCAQSRQFYAAHPKTTETLWTPVWYQLAAKIMPWLRRFFK